MVRLRGRSPRGERLPATAPFGHWQTQSFIAGLCCHGLTAPWIVDKAMDRIAFDLHVETQLAPALAKGDIVILDNLAVHKSDRAARCLAGRGARFLFLPPYSPDLNPIEMAFAKLKAPLRRCTAEPSTRSGRPPATSASSSQPQNAETSSNTQDMGPIKRPTL